MPRSSQSSKQRSGQNKATAHGAHLAPSPIIGSGEMADIIRKFDWSGTPLGPVESWSDTLVTTVNLVLASRHPMFLWWGTELIQFYNDGYRPSIRDDKHPSAIGQRGIECWPEIWSIIGPQIESVMKQGASTWNTNALVPINRNGKLEEVYWTYGYSPVRDKDGTIQGTLVVCSETTEQVLSERRLRTLLAITAESLVLDQPAQSPQLLPFARTIVEQLDRDPSDIPFAAMYLLSDGNVVHVASTAANGFPGDPEQWPVAKVVESQAPITITDLHSRFGEIVCKPWPEPVSQAYVLPISVRASSIQAVMVFGISPRLPFDERYRTFLHLVGNRISGLLESEVHQIEIAQAAKRFYSLAEADPFGMMIADLHGHLTYVNPAFLKRLGYTEAEVSAGKVRWDELTPPEFAAADANAVQQLQASGRCEVYEKALLTKAGKRIPILAGAAVIDTLDGDPEVAAFVTDLTPLKMAEEALRQANNELEKQVKERTAALESEVVVRNRAELSLRELTGRLLRMQDEERRHMARELHDHAGQTLVAMTINLSILDKAAKLQDPKISSLAAQTKNLSDELSREIRTLSYLLHPPLLDEAGLESALRWYVEGFSQRSNIKVDLGLPPNLGRLPEELELVTFRVIQESLSNVHRHSGSDSAKITLTRTETSLAFEISDRGTGIVENRQRDITGARAGVGVRGMQERVRQFGGTLQITSNGEGTRVVVNLPL
jgi:PAS domain S-box-containing protein